MMNNKDVFEATYAEDLYLIPTPTTVVISSKWATLTELEIALLTKILNSVRLSIASVRIVELKELDLSQWEEKPSKLIGFGVKIPGVAFYDMIATPETRLVLADGLDTLSKDDDLKKQLWISLKQLFSL
jgi:hypothetical protein